MKSCCLLFALLGMQTLVSGQSILGDTYPCQGQMATYTLEPLALNYSYTSISWSAPQGTHSFFQSSGNPATTLEVIWTSGPGQVAVNYWYNEPDNPGGGTFSGSATLGVTVNSPTDPLFNMGGGGQTCPGSAGVSVTLSGSTSGISYQLLRNNVHYVGNPKTGNGPALSWPNLTTEGTYTVLATNSSTSCSHLMSGNAAISPGTPPTNFTVGGGGFYTTGEPGLTITLNGSQTGVNYQLRIAGANSGAPVAGTGSSISWPSQTTGGTYTVRATIVSTYCTSIMNGDAVITVYPQPAMTCPNQPVPYSVILPSGPNVGVVNFTGWTILQGIGSIANSTSPETTVTWISGPGHLLAEYNWEDLEQFIPAPPFTDHVVHYESQQFNLDILAPRQFEVSGGGAICAGAPGRTITLSGSEYGYNYQLLLGGTNVGSPLAGSPAGLPLSWTGKTALGTYTVVSTNVAHGCVTNMLGSAVLVSTPSPSQFSPHITSSGTYRRAIMEAVGSGLATDHFWQSAPPGTTILDGTSTTYPVTSTWTTTSSSVVYIARHDIEGNCWSYSSGTQVALDLVPPQAAITQIQEYGYNTIDIDIPDKAYALGYASYYFQESSTSQLVDANKLWAPGYKLFASDEYYIKGRDVSGVWGPTTSFTVKLKKDYDLNFIHTRSFDGSKDEILLGESKNYFGNTGKSLQSQARTIASGKIFISEGILDEFDRSIGAFLPAPLAGSEFRYTPMFTLTTDGNKFNFNDLNTPALSTSQVGTVGWYYSDNNTDEPLTPQTAYPYARSTFYSDGFGEQLASARPGEVHKIGSGHEAISGSFPVHNELADYMAKRPNFVPTNSGINLFHSGVQTVGRDENGKFAVSISDKSGKTVMSARPGTASQNVLTIVSTVVADAVSTSSTFNPFVYFYLLTPQSVSISGTGTFQIEDIISNQVITPGATWPVGFYRVKALTGTRTLTYTNYFQDVAYLFYDDAGRLVVSLTPNAYKQWVVDGITDVNLLDKTSYTYNHQGWLLEMTEPDAGTSKYGYRRDGKIRFSQNAKQRKDTVNNRYSYTNYDGLGRPVESGEYTPPDLSQYYFNQVRFNATKLESFGNAWMGTGTTIDWIKTHYDFPAASSDHPGFSFPTGYAQKFLRGGVSWTENKNMQTFYSYNEKGQVTWMIRRPKPLMIGPNTINLDKSFLLQYNYDPSGNVLDVTYVPVDNSGNLILTERFIHYYEYDASKRLIKAFSGTDGLHKKLRAQYYYYLHGPLKRIELGERLQGIDFIYNIHGWLTAINDPNTANDPGQDGYTGAHQNFKKDAFGMILDYYESSMGGLFSANLMDDPSYYHRIPDLFNSRERTSIAFAGPFGSNESMNEIRKTILQAKILRTTR